MATSTSIAPEVFTVPEIARAAGVSTAEVRTLLDESAILPVGGRFLTLSDALSLVALLRTPDEQRRQRRLFAPAQGTLRRGGMPAAASGAFHAGILLAMVLISTLGVRTAPAERPVPDPVRLVFVATPGPGGGGGGGGLRQPVPAARAELKGTSKLRGPVTLTRKV